MDMDIEKLVVDTVKTAVEELRKTKVIDDNFGRTEKVLYNYPKFKEALKEKRLLLEEIERIGVPGRSASVVRFSGGVGSDPTERAEKIKNELLMSIMELERYILRIELALECITADKFADLVVMRYFEGKSLAVIAAYYNTSITSVVRAKDRLVEKIKAHLFCKETMEVLLDD